MTQVATGGSQWQFDDSSIITTVFTTDPNGIATAPVYALDSDDVETRVNNVVVTPDSISFTTPVTGTNRIEQTLSGLSIGDSITVTVTVVVLDALSAEQTYVTIKEYTVNSSSGDSANISESLDKIKKLKNAKVK